jgi:hypothetical protein
MQRFKLAIYKIIINLQNIIYFLSSFSLYILETLNYKIEFKIIFTTQNRIYYIFTQINTISIQLLERYNIIL